MKLKTYLHENEDIFTPTRKDESLMTQEEVNATQIQLFMLFPNWVRRQVLLLKKEKVNLTRRFECPSSTLIVRLNIMFK